METINIYDDNPVFSEELSKLKAAGLLKRCFAKEKGLEEELKEQLVEIPLFSKNVFNFKNLVLNFEEFDFLLEAKERGLIYAPLLNKANFKIHQPPRSNKSGFLQILKIYFN